MCPCKKNKWVCWVLVGPRSRPTWFVDEFSVLMMLTGDSWFPNETGRTAWEVKGRTVLCIREFPDLSLGMADVWSEGVEVVVWFVLGTEVVVQVLTGFVVEVVVWLGLWLRKRFFPVVYPLSLLLFKFTDKSIFSGCSSGVCCFCSFYLKMVVKERLLFS